MASLDPQAQNDTQQRNLGYDEHYDDTVRAFTEFLDSDVCIDSISRVRAAQLPSFRFQPSWQTVD